jgi:hypothetical protein
VKDQKEEAQRRHATADVPAFYTPGAEDATTVQCCQGHVMARETALKVGRQSYARWGCPYCLWSGRERDISMRAYEVGFADGQAAAREQR